MSRLYFGGPWHVLAPFEDPFGRFSGPFRLHFYNAVAPFSGPELHNYMLSWDWNGIFCGTGFCVACSIDCKMRLNIMLEVDCTKSNAMLAMISSMFIRWKFTCMSECLFMSCVVFLFLAPLPFIRFRVRPKTCRNSHISRVRIGPGQLGRNRPCRTGRDASLVDHVHIRPRRPAEGRPCHTEHLTLLS